MFHWLWPVPCTGCGSPGSRWCDACRPAAWQRPRSRSEGVDAVFTLARYGSPLGQAVRRAKIDGDRTRAVHIARLFGHELLQVFPRARPDAILPAPSSRSALRRRGFSLAALLAREAGRSLGVPVLPVLTSRATGRLAKLGAQERRLALRGRIRARTLVPGTVLLVDDVLTTGATAEAAATELLGGATDRVLLATTVAVTELPSPTFGDR